MENCLKIVRSPFVVALGIELTSARNGESELSVTLAESHINTWSIAHGGVTMTLADVSMSVAAASLVEDDIGCVTIELKLTFMQPGRGRLHGTAKCLHRTSSMAYCEAEVRDTGGLLVAKALGTFRYIKRSSVAAA